MSCQPQGQRAAFVFHFDTMTPKTSWECMLRCSFAKACAGISNDADNGEHTLAVLYFMLEMFVKACSWQC